jgi:NADPH:quinone reductase-like Zn-dependent oxidoreductase
MPGAVPEIPKQQVAIVGREGGGLEVNRSAAVPALEDDMVLVKNAAVAVNPVDTKMAAPHLVAPGTIAGHDFAGKVVAVGSNVWTAGPVAVGDRVCGAVQVSRGSYINPTAMLTRTIRGCTSSLQAWERTPNMLGQPTSCS